MRNTLQNAFWHNDTTTDLNSESQDGLNPTFYGLNLIFCLANVSFAKVTLFSIYLMLLVVVLCIHKFYTILLESISLILLKGVLHYMKLFMVVLPVKPFILYKFLLTYVSNRVNMPQSFCRLPSLLKKAWE